jgi:hypothetical protein
MDTSSIASLATSMTSTATSQAVGIAVQKKAMDIEASGALALLQAIPPVPATHLPPHLGQNINTTA